MHVSQILFCYKRLKKTKKTHIRPDFKISHCCTFFQVTGLFLVFLIGFHLIFNVENVFSMISLKLCIFKYFTEMDGLLNIQTINHNTGYLFNVSYSVASHLFEFFINSL